MKLVLSSQDRETPSMTSTTDFSINLTDISYIQGFEGGLYVSLASITVPYTVYNVRANHDTLVYTGPSGVRTITLTHGFYTTSTFASALQTAITTQLNADVPGDTMAVAYNATTMRLEFTPTLAAGTFQFNPVSQAGFNMQNLMGYGDISSDPSATATGVLFSPPHVPFLGGVDQLYLYMDLPGAGSYNTHNRKFDQGLMATIPVPGGLAPGGYISHVFPHSYGGWMLKERGMPSSVKVRLCDHEMQPIDLQGSEWTMTLDIFGDLPGLPIPGYIRMDQMIRPDYGPNLNVSPMQWGEGSQNPMWTRTINARQVPLGVTSDYTAALYSSQPPPWRNVAPGNSGFNPGGAWSQPTNVSTSTGQTIGNPVAPMDPYWSMPR